MATTTGVAPGSASSTPTTPVAVIRHHRHHADDEPVI